MGRFPGARVTDSCELPSGCWEWNLGPLGERPVFFGHCVSSTHSLGVVTHTLNLTFLKIDFITANRRLDKRAFQFRVI